MEHLEQENQKLQQMAIDSDEILPFRFQERTQLSSTNIFCPNRTAAIGVGFFISSNEKVITALHILDQHYQNCLAKNVLVNGVIHRRQQNGEIIEEEVQFEVLRVQEQFDLAVLQLYSTTADAFLEIPSPNYDFQKKKMAITSFSSALHEQAPAVVLRSFCVIPAFCVKSSPHHIVYISTLFSGYSGGAILMSHDGIVRAMHQETVNQAREELRRENLDEEEVVNSINSLISCLSQGFIGLRLDAPDVQKFIMS